MKNEFINDNQIITLIKYLNQHNNNVTVAVSNNEYVFCNLNKEPLLRIPKNFSTKECLNEINKKFNTNIDLSIFKEPVINPTNTNNDKAKPVQNNTSSKENLETTKETTTEPKKDNTNETESHENVNGSETKPIQNNDNSKEQTANYGEAIIGQNESIIDGYVVDVKIEDYSDVCNTLKSCKTTLDNAISNFEDASYVLTSKLKLYYNSVNRNNNDALKKYTVDVDKLYNSIADSIEYYDATDEELAKYLEEIMGDLLKEDNTSDLPIEDSSSVKGKYEVLETREDGGACKIRSADGSEYWIFMQNAGAWKNTIYHHNITISAGGCGPTSYVNGLCRILKISDYDKALKLYEDFAASCGKNCATGTNAFITGGSYKSGRQWKDFPEHWNDVMIPSDAGESVSMTDTLSELGYTNIQQAVKLKDLKNQTEDFTPGSIYTFKSTTQTITSNDAMELLKEAKKVNPDAYIEVMSAGAGRGNSGPFSSESSSGHFINIELNSNEDSAYLVVNDSMKFTDEYRIGETRSQWHEDENGLYLGKNDEYNRVERIGSGTFVIKSLNEKDPVDFTDNQAMFVLNIPPLE